MQVRLLLPGDERLLIEVAALLDDPVITPKRATMLLAEPTFFIVVAFSDEGEMMGRIYGHVLHRYEQTDLLLYEVDVAEQHQRKGAAVAMIEFVKAVCRENDYREMWVLTEAENAPARALYLAGGGVREGGDVVMYVFYPHE